MKIENNELPSEEPLNSLPINNLASNKETSEEPKKQTPTLLRRFFSGLWQEIVEKQVIHKLIALLFALLVFGFVYLQMVAHRSVLTYMGVMLLMVLVYVEILVIRDHLWVIEGSMRESRKWRDVFFNQSSLRRQRLRKLLIVLFALAIFSYVYMKVPKNNNPVLSFMGIILMITMLYYEILTIRDEVAIMLQAITYQEGKKELVRKAEYEKFLKPETDKSIEAKNIDISAKPDNTVQSVAAQNTDSNARPYDSSRPVEAPNANCSAEPKAGKKSGKHKKSAKAR